MPDPVRPPLVTRHFLLLCAITFVTFLAAFQMFPTVPLRLLEIGASRAQTGWFMAAFTAGSSLGALFTGPLGDRVGQRRMMIAGALGFALFIGSYGFLPGLGWFCVLAFPHGVVWSGLLTATMATLGGILPPERRADGMSIYGLASPGGAMLGPLIGVVLFGRWGFGAIGWSNAALFSLLAFLAFTLPADRPKAEKAPLFRLPEPVMLTPCLVLFTSALAYGVLNTYTVQEAVAMKFTGLQIPWIGTVPTDSVFLFSLALGMVAMRVVMSRVGFGVRPVAKLPAMMLAATLGLGILALAPGGFLRHGLSGLVYGAGYSMMHTLVTTYVLNVIHAERRGPAFGSILFSFDSGIGLGNLGLGALIGHSGFRWGWSAAALITAATLPMAIHLARKDARRNLPTEGA